MTLRPDRPAASPDTTQSRPRIKQIHIPTIFSPPPSSPRQTHTPIKPVQPNTQTVRISSPSQPASPQLPGHSPLPAEPRRPVVETGEAGPPGYMRRVTVRRGSEDSTSEPVKGFAGAPGGFGSKFIILTYTVYWLFLTCDYNLSLCVHGRINICSFRDQKWIWPNPNYKPQITVWVQIKYQSRFVLIVTRVHLLENRQKQISSCCFPASSTAVFSKLFVGKHNARQPQKKNNSLATQSMGNNALHLLRNDQLCHILEDIFAL